MTNLKQEFSKLFDFFSLDDNERAEKFVDVINEIVKFSEKMQEEIVKGSDEERKEIQEFLDKLKVQVEEEKSKLFEKMGISEDALKEYISNKENFSDEEWTVMQEMKKQVKEELDPKSEKPKKINKKRSNKTWIQS
ncbi:MAG: hypothetical protein WCT85_03035 [Parachlamydiales bacterium]|jgi:hypothetical protein